MDIAIAIAAKIVEFSVAPVGRQLGYLFHPKMNVEILEDELQKLQARRQDVQHLVEAAIRENQAIEYDVRTWLTRADVMVKDAESFFDMDGKAKCSCSNTGFFRSYYLSRKANKMLPEIVQIQDCYFATPFGVSRSSDIALESRTGIMNKIMEALCDPHVKMIGVWGPGGVGKTTLVKSVARRAEGDYLFDTIMMAVVTWKPDPIGIQGQLADMLGLKLEKVSLHGRASRLRSRLMGERTVLIILDDIWENIDLQEVGIPMGDEHGGLKILFTGRDLEVLKSMGAQQLFSVRTLSETEELQLFQKVTTNDSVKLATMIAKSCHGLPLPIVHAIARASKDSGFIVWKDALELLETLSSKEDGTFPDVSSVVEMGYRRLSEELKFTFLLCSLLGDRISYEDILKYGLGLGLFEGIETVEDARSRVYMLMGSLRQNALLLDSETHDLASATMNDIVLNVGRSIASQERNMIVVENNIELEKLLDKDMINFTAISLLGNQIDEVPEGIKCSELRLLHVSNVNPSLRIPDKFFQGITGLQVLGMAKMDLTVIPSSLYLLTSIQNLSLDQCVLGDIAMIGDLRSLKVLSLSNTNIELLPSKIGLLTRLCLLELSNCSKLVEIPANVISKLTRLEELYMQNCFIQWEVEGVNNERSKVSIVELNHLSNLTALEIHLPDTEVLPNASVFDKLLRYKISIGYYHSRWSPKYEISRSLRLKLNKGVKHWEHGLQLLFKKAEELWLGEIDGVKHLVPSEIDKDGFLALKHLRVEGNAELECIVNATKQRDSSVVLPVLESLVLIKVSNLRELCSGHLSATSFSSLQVVKVKHCDNLKFVLLSTMAGGIFLLKELEVSQCRNMGAIVVDENENEAEVIEFPHLHTLTLEGLPRLMGFFSNLNPRTQESHTDMIGTKEITLEGNLTSHRLFDDKVRLPSLKRLVVSNCSRLTHLFPHNIAMSLVEIQEIEISNCDLLEEVVKREKVVKREEAKIDMLVFPLLNSLTLTNLPNLASSGIRFLQFASFEKLRINGCPHIETFAFSNLEKETNSAKKRGNDISPFFPEKVSLPDLKELNLCMLNHVEEICKDPIFCFKNLISLELKECGNLEYFFSVPVATGLQFLESLSVISCNLVKEIIVVKSEATAVAGVVLFPRVNTLILENLQSLESFCSVGCIIKWSFLKNVRVKNCPKIREFGLGKVDRPKLKSVKVADWQEQETDNNEISIGYLFELSDPLSVIKRLTIDGSEALKQRLGMKLQESSYCQLTELLATNCDAQLNIFLSRLLSKAQQLEQLRVENSESLNHVFNLEGVVADEKGETYFNQLKIMRFCDLPKLMCIWNKDPSGVLGLHNLSSIHVLSCASLKNLFSTSVAKNIQECLKELRINTCEMMEEVVTKETEENETEKEQIVFWNLENLELVCLSKIVKFHKGNTSFQFPSLQTLRIENCPQMNAFTTGTRFLCTQIPTIIDGSSEEMPDTFPEAFPKLQKLTLVSLRNFEEIWQGSVTQESSSELRELVVDTCGELIRVIPSQMLSTFKNMQRLRVENCESVREVFPLHEPHSIVLPQLSELVLTSLPNLIHIINRQLVGPSVFQNLKILRVQGCCCLINLCLPLASCLKLKELKISDCKNLEEIFTKVGRKTDDLFHDLHTVVLESLPKLSTFCLETFVLPSLVKLIIADCPALKKFPPELNGMGNLPTDAESFFANWGSFEKLEELHLMYQDGVKRIWSENLPSKCFSQLKALILDKNRELLNVIPSSLLIRFKMLKKLTVERCDSLEVVFDLPDGMDEELKEQPIAKSSCLCGIWKGSKGSYTHSLSPLSKEAISELEVMTPRSEQRNLTKSSHRLSNEGLLLQLSELVLSNLPEVVRVWNKEPIVPVFQNLTSLQIVQCNNLKRLIFLATAKNLEQLTLLKLYKCENLEQVFPDETESTKEMTFPKLKCLVLKYLPNLVSFCQQGCSLTMPELQVVSVTEIPEMKTFSGVAQSTPMLKAVEVTYIRKYWQGELNATIEQLYKEKSTDSGSYQKPLKPLRLLEMPLTKILQERVATQEGIEIVSELDQEGTDGGSYQKPLRLLEMPLTLKSPQCPILVESSSKILQERVATQEEREIVSEQDQEGWRSAKHEIVEEIAKEQTKTRRI
ncbi:Disease resistance protein [Quillaja saponaria]|uniref:Disease resistance protein n=1 Tax=Quillaja saponaria TaxID=32244 RepID=A0AAD7QAW3_QUISA|nr:Disease resistance protein [Quillaja saponaria]